MNITIEKITVNAEFRCLRKTAHRLTDGHSMHKRRRNLNFRRKPITWKLGSMQNLVCVHGPDFATEMSKTSEREILC